MERASAKTESIHFRRHPRQPRAEKTVARIMDATLALILETGYSSLTTNRIAEKAGVNIASLYQYFPGKQASARAIYESAAAEYAGTTNVAIMSQLSAPLEQGLRHIVRETLKLIARERAVFIHLVEEVPELRQSATAISLEKLSVEVSHRYVKHHLPGVDDATIRLRTFCLQYACMPLIIRYVLDRPAGVSQARFVEEVSRIGIAILKG